MVQLQGSRHPVMRISCLTKPTAGWLATGEEGVPQRAHYITIECLPHADGYTFAVVLGA